METPLQLTFHQLPPSAALEVDVNRWVAELEECFDGIVGCASSSTRLTTTTTRAAATACTSSSAFRGAQIVVDRPTDENGAHEDPYVALRDAFLAARRRLEDHVHRLRGEVKDHHLRAWPGRSPRAGSEVRATLGRRRAGDLLPPQQRHRRDRPARARRRGPLPRGARRPGSAASTVEPIGANGQHREASS